MKRANPVIILLVSMILFVAIIPIIINEAYKYGSLYGGYITIWDAADVLSYYGTILGAAITIIVLALTISFTRKQILRETYLKSEHDKWSKIESVFADALNTINPMRPLIETMDTGLTNPSAAITAIQKYQISCRIATDPLNACLNSIDYPKVKVLIDAIVVAADQFFQISQEEVEAYTKFRDFLNRDTARKTVEMEEKLPNSFPIETLAAAERILNDTNGLRQEDIQDTINQLNERMIAAYHGTYRALLQLKGSTLEQIDHDVQNNADSILQLWGRK